MWVDNYWFPEQTQEQLPAPTVGTLLATAMPRQEHRVTSSWPQPQVLLLGSSGPTQHESV